MDSPEEAERVIYDQIENENIVRADVGWSPDDSQLIYLRNPRRGMCGEGDGRKVKGVAIGVSNVNLGEIFPIDKDGLSCDEVAIARGGRNPDWWRGALCGDGALGGAEACDDGNRIDGDGCSAVCTVEP